MISSRRLAFVPFLIVVAVSIYLSSIPPAACSDDHDNGIIPEDGVTSTTTCRSYCGNITVDYPFGVRSGCGHSGFRDLLYCINNMLMLHIPSGTYRVLNIDYAYNSLTLHDASMSDCYSLKLLTMSSTTSTSSSTSSGFMVEAWRAPYLSPAPDNVFMLLGCHADSPLFQGFPGKHLPCRNVSGMGCDDYYRCPAWGFSQGAGRSERGEESAAYGSAVRPPPDCCSLAFGAIRSINLTHLRCQGYSSAYSLAPLRLRGPGEWSYGIRLTYSVPSDRDADCRACQATGGLCGHDPVTSADLCLCPGGRNSTSNCDSVSSLASNIKHHLSSATLINGLFIYMVVWMSTL